MLESVSLSDVFGRSTRKWQLRVGWHFEEDVIGVSQPSSGVLLLTSQQALLHKRDCPKLFATGPEIWLLVRVRSGRCSRGAENICVFSVFIHAPKYCSREDYVASSEGWGSCNYICVQSTSHQIIFSQTREVKVDGWLMPKKIIIIKRERN